VVWRSDRLHEIRYDHNDRSVKSKSGAFSPVIAVNRAAAKPMHRQIYDAYREAIVSGSLRPGQRIPSTRAAWLRS